MMPNSDIENIDSIPTVFVTKKTLIPFMTKVMICA